MTKQEKPDVLLVTIDSLRVDRIGCLNQEGKSLTPNLDRLAENSIVFSNAYSNGPKSKASFPSIFTSTLPFYKGQYADISGRKTFTELLNQNGYFTAGYTENPWLRPIYGYDQGFDIYNTSEASESTRKIKDKIKSLMRSNKYLKRLLLKIRVNNSSITPQSKELESDSLLKFYRKHKSEDNSFIWLHSHITHTPYLPTENDLEDVGFDGKAPKTKKEFYDIFGDQKTEAEREKITKLYDASVRQADRFIGNLMNEIDLSETILIVHSDHGEELFEHGSIGHSDFYDETLKVPLIVSIPGHEHEVRDYRVELADIGPTILDLANLNSPSEFRGKSLLEKENRTVISQSRESPEGQFKDEKQHFKVSVIQSKFKYIYSSYQENELYNLSEDPEESENIIDEKKEVADRLNRVIEENEAFPSGEEIEPEINDEEVKKKLKDLGYKS